MLNDIGKGEWYSGIGYNLGAIACIHRCGNVQR